ncbi:MAG: YfhO family protein [Candidatus Nomurabacteria bacterium]|jgi:uncharacterized membrane protein YfhO|nr:YfhO family protein [Candidatus Nomurabacteria bacterium]
MKKTQKPLKPSFKSFLPYLLAFFLPAILFFLVFHIQRGGLWPFGENSILTIDAEGQYVPFFAYLKSMVFGDNDFFYSFGNIIGGDAFGFAAYYLFSPFNFIYLIIPTETIAFLIVTLLKIGTAGLCAFIFLKKHFKQKAAYSAVIFSTSYAFMLYNVAFYSNTMFLDGVIWLPLVFLGIDKLMETGRTRFYVLALSSILCFQYYMAYMLCIAAVLYFGYLYLLKNWGRVRQNLVQVRKFVLSSLIAAALSALVTLPTFLSLTTTKRLAMVGADNIIVYLTQYSFLAPLFQIFGVPSERMHTIYSPAFVFCGVMVALLAMAYFVGRSVRLREKILSLGFVTVLLASFALPPLNFVWHAFSIPNGFSFRYAFILSFFLIILAYQGFLNLQHLQPMRRKTVVMFIAVVNLASLFAMNAFSIHNTVTDGAHYIRNYKEFNEMTLTMRSAVQSLHEQDPGMYRVEKSFQYTENDPMLYGYNGLTHFSSSTGAGTMSLLGDRLFFVKMERIGLATIYKNTMTASIDSLLGVKYFFKDEVYDNGVERGVDIFQTSYALPLGFMADQDLLSADLEGLEYFELQNKMFQALSGNDTPIFTTTEFSLEDENMTKTELPDSSVEYTTQNKRDYGYLYVTAPSDDDKLYYFDFVWNKDLQIALNNRPFVFAHDDLTGEVPEPPMLLTDKYSVATDSPRLEIEVPETVTVKAAPFWQESKTALGEHYAELADEPCELNKITGSHLTCTVEAFEDGNLFFSIPNDKGWVVKVDGKQVKTETALDLFMAIPLTAGTHDIELKYTPRGLEFGVFISFTALLVCTIYITKKFWQRTNTLMASVLNATVFSK